MNFLLNPHHVDPLPPPHNVQLVRVTSEGLTFNWSSVEPGCSSLQYRTESDCGTCTSDPLTTTFVTCSIAAITDNVCSFSVRSVVCNNITGSWSSPVNVNLKGV